jgi:hypothetical protein
MNPARATISRITHFLHNHYINISTNHPILQSVRSEPPTHTSKSVRNKRRTICLTTLDFHLGASITPSHVHILLVGNLIKRQDSMEVIRSSPMLQAGTHGQVWPTTWYVCHAKNTRHSPKLSIPLGHPSSPPIKRCLLHHGTHTSRAPTS